MKEMYKNYLNENIEVLNKMRDLDGVYDQVVESIVDCLKNDHKIIFAGNGGSAADAMHIATDLTLKFKLVRNPFFALSLASNPAAITAIGNDFSFDNIFSKQVQAYGREGDIFVGISISGKSKNIVEAIDMAKKQGLKTILITGNPEGAADILVSIPSQNGSIIQNLYLTFLHIVCDKVEVILTNENKN